jgi:hypothetical protein
VEPKVVVNTGNYYFKAEKYMVQDDLKKWLSLRVFAVFRLKHYFISYETKKKYYVSCKVN